MTCPKRYVTNSFTNDDIPISARKQMNPQPGKRGLAAGVSVTSLAMTATAFLTLGLSPESTFAQFDHYEPFVAVDLGPMLLSAIDPESTYTNLHITEGEVLDINEEGYACGWVRADANGWTDEEQYAFFFSPVDGGSITILPEDSASYTADYDDPVATALTSIDNAFGIKVVGYAYPDTQWGIESLVWSFDGSSWDFERVFDGSPGDYPGQGHSVTNDVNESLLVTGMFNMQGSQDGSPCTNLLNGEYTYVADMVTEGTPDTFDLPVECDRIDNYGYVGSGLLTRTAMGYGIDDDGDVAGTQWHYAQGGAEEGFVPLFYGLNSTPVQLGLVGADTEGAAYGINDDHHVVGWSGDAIDDCEPVLWWYNNSTWTPYRITLEQTFSAAEARSINNHNEIVGTYTNGPNGAWYGIVGSLGSGGFTVHLDVELSGTVLFPSALRADADVWTANVINDKGWIGGSFKPDTNQDEYRPIILVPNDMDNDGESDIREILLGDELDVNGNWLIDWAENDSTNTDQYMRVGLHAPGTDGRSGSGDDDETKMLLVDHVQIVRLPLKYERLGAQVDFTLDFGIEDVVSPSNCTLCTSFHDRLVEWGSSNGEGGSQQREIVVTLRNVILDNSNYDYIPVNDPQNEDFDYDDKIDALRTFAFRYAHCIDYMQFGNEAFTVNGPGSFFVDVGNGDEHISTLTGTDYSDGTALIIQWFEDQVDVARQASALAGRPLRFIGPGFPIGNIRVGHGGTQGGGNLITQADRMGYAIDEVLKYVDASRMYFDTHLHYEAVENVTSTNPQTGAIAAITDNTGSAWAGNAPDCLMALEWGPKTTAGWGSTNQGTFEKYFDAAKGDPATDWDTFVDGWETIQFTSGFDFPAVLTVMYDNRYATACYGPSIQARAKAGLNIRFDVAALRAQHVRDGWIDDSDKFTDMLSERYQDVNAAPNYVVSPFEPHCTTCNECDVDVTCPGCSG